jgi:hypothetical protein
MDPAEKEALMGMTEVDSPASRPSFLVRALRLLVGLTLAGLLGVGLGVLGYVGIPWLYRGFSDPVLIQATRLARQEAELQDLRASLDQTGVEREDRLAELESQAATQTAELAEQRERAEALTSELERMRGELSELSGSADQLAAQEATLGELAAQLEALQTLIAEGGGPLDRLERNLALTQAGLHVLRARLWLIENNAGLAGEEVEAARAVLEAVAQNAPAEQAAALRDILERLRLTLEDLQLRPLVAADDLEIAWQLLSQMTETP